VEAGATKWKVERRFADFYGLYEEVLFVCLFVVGWMGGELFALQLKKHGADVPETPPKKLFNNMENEVCYFLVGFALLCL